MALRATALSITFAATSAACQCREQPSTEVLIASHTTVFVGQVLSGRLLGDGSVHGSRYGREFVLAPSLTLKGKFPDKQVRIWTGMANGDCGTEFSIGAKYLVYANANAHGKLSTGLCDYTKPYVGQVQNEVREIRRILNLSSTD